jgi:hypothetical protein
VHETDDAQLAGVRDEVRTLASMVLIASPTLFDDPEARLFLEEVQRLVGTMYAAPALAFSAPAAGDSDNTVARLSASKSRVEARVVPLAARLPKQYRAGFDELRDPPPPNAPTWAAADMAAAARNRGPAPF